MSESADAYRDLLAMQGSQLVECYDRGHEIRKRGRRYSDGTEQRVAWCQTCASLPYERRHRGDQQLNEFSRIAGVLHGLVSSIDWENPLPYRDAGEEIKMGWADEHRRMSGHDDIRVMTMRVGGESQRFERCMVCGAQNPEPLPQSADVLRDRFGDRLFLTVAEAAELMMVDRRTLRRAMEAGQVPGVRIGNVWRVPVEGFRTLLGNS